MFGHDKSDSKAADTIEPTTDSATAPVPEGELTLPVPADDTSVADTTVADDTGTTADDVPADNTSTDTAVEDTPAEAASSQIGINPSGTFSDLSSLKQQALHELSPLIGKLDQSPDERYATAKMVYEETKDQNILNAVYEAAKNLPDETDKAAAIYDIIKKINELK